MSYRLYYMLLRMASSLRHNLAWRFTPAGQFLLGSLVVSAALGLDTNRNVAYQVFTILLALLLISLASRRFFRPRISARRVLPKTGTVGVPVPYHIYMSHSGKVTLQGLEVAERLPDPRPAFADFKRGAQIWMAAGGKWMWESWYRVWKNLTESGRIARSFFQPAPPLTRRGEIDFRMEVMPLKRGRLELSEIVVRRSDLFGLVNAFVHLPAQQSILIIPRRYPVPDFSLPGTRAYQQGGVTLSTSVADSEEFLSLREYRPGDPMRVIHWKSWARAGKPVIKEFQDEFFVRHALVLDTFTTGPDGLFEEAVSVAASFACTVQTQESLLDLLFVGAEAYCETAGRGQGQTERLLEVLACVRPCRDKPFSVLGAFVRSRRESVSGCICVLLAWDEDRKRFIELLAGLGVKTLAIVIADRSRSNVTAPGAAEQPPWLHILETGKIEEGLARL